MTLGSDGDSPGDDPVVLRLEEEAEVHPEARESGSVHVSRRVETHPVSTTVPRRREDVSIEHAPAAEEDSGEVETLPDGSVSIPVLEEEIVITRRTVVRERVIVRKKVVTEYEDVSVDLRRERVAIDADDQAAPKTEETKEAL
jgi:uncharacterized protein (TIGR02271 family)